MKRGGPIARRTMLRRTPFRPAVTLKPRRAREADAIYGELRHLLCQREHGCCARCGKTGQSLYIGTVQHRQKRSQGGPDDGWNCVWCCAECNAGWIEANPTEAKRQGWTVPSWADSREWPVFYRGAWQQPTPTGWVAAQPREEQVA